ncbi:hypothetical protein V6N13_082002 [Hibiscus sabdariffa]|uniref:Uncharacterized protein n=1 Tax=Hibiscus sabdariffa TaxID=183260 RepID=A0ABR2DCW5_9ROSI
MQGLQQFCLNRMTKGMSRQRQRVLPRQKSRLELGSRQSVLLCYWLIRDYSDPIASPIEFPFLPRPRISADVRFSADVLSAHF